MAVQTYGIPPEEERTDPVTGQPVASPNTATPETSTSAPPLSGGQQSVNTPVAEATNTQGGGAEPPSYQGPDPMQDSGQTPDTMIQDTAHKKPDKFLADQQAAYEALRKVRAKAGDKAAQLEIQLLNERLGIGDGVAAKEQAEAQAMRGIDRAEEDGTLTSKQAKQKRFALKNIYRVIKPEEMGLFLIDFGLRAMMAGETMGDLGALGAAGSGAMGALQERRRYDEEQRIAAEQRGVEAGGRAAEDWETAAGIAHKTRELDIEESSGGGMKWQSQYLASFYRDLGYSEAEIGRILAGGPDNTELINENIKRIHSEVERIRANEDELLAGNPAFPRKKVKVPDENGNLVEMNIAEMSEDDITRLAYWTAEQSIQKAGALRSRERATEATQRALAGAARE